MAGLVLTTDADAMDDGEEDEEAGPTLAKSAGGLFGDLVSEDENGFGGARGWDFEAQHAVDDSGAKPEVATTLRAKIQARLQERAEAGAEDGGGAKKKKKRKGAKASADEAAVSEENAKKEEAVADVEVPGAKKAAASNDLETLARASHLATGIHFSELRLSRPLLRALGELRFESPTPIQRDVIPQALKGLDILATAETGSGKTASFLLPALERLCQSANVRGRKRDAKGRVIAGGRVATKALVMLPTRELAVQCHAMLRDLARFTMVTFQLVAGGFVSQDQASSLRNQPDIVVATPGRMLDHLLNTQSVHMELLEIVIFDEADRLLELGFREECNQVLKCCSKGRQTMLFSATHNASVEELAKLALVKPVRIKASPVNQVATTLEQEFVKAPSEELREAVLLSLCSRVYTTGVIIFCSTRKAAHRLAMVFGLSNLNFAELHGNLPQTERVNALSRFQKREANFLLATDIAARGLDLNNVDTVINFHLPLDSSRYIHRVGRTARMGRTGRAVTIYTPTEYNKVKLLGRQCCNKVKSKVLKRSVAGEAIEQWASKIAAMEEDIAGIGDEESLERELRLADVLTGKSENLQKHKAAINARPAKTWFMTNVEKQKLKEQDAAEVAEKDKAGRDDGAGKGGAGDQNGKKRNRGGRNADEDDEDAREARRVKRMRDKHKQKKDLERAERAQLERKMRASARRVKKSSRPGAKQESGGGSGGGGRQGKKKKGGGR